MGIAYDQEAILPLNAYSNVNTDDRDYLQQKFFELNRGQ